MSNVLTRKFHNEKKCGFFPQQLYFLPYCLELLNFNFIKQTTNVKLLFATG